MRAKGGNQPFQGLSPDSKHAVMVLLMELPHGGGALTKHLPTALAVLIASGGVLRSAAAGDTIQLNSADPILRLAPITSARSTSQEPSPAVPTTKNTITVLMHYYGEKGHPILWLRVPQQFVRGRPDKIVSNVGMSFEVSYPDMKGAFAPGNENLFGCTGYCRGRMMIELQDRSGAEPNPTAALTLAQRFKTCTNIHLSTVRGFDQEVRCDGPKGYPTLAEIYYVQRKQRGIVSEFVTCRPYTPVPMCDEWIRLPKHEGVEVHYHFNMREMSGWPSVRNHVATLVDGFVVKALPATS